MSPSSRLPRLVTEPLGGSRLSRLAQDGAAPAEWYLPRPASADDWKTHAESARDTVPSDWWSAISPACAPRGRALDRLTRVLDGRGVVVTTGQQPGLFGGPIYTWSKAISALAVADAVESATGTPVVPFFWAATDDSDFAEAATTWVSRPGGAECLTLPGAGDDRSLADVPLPDVDRLLDALERASGSASNSQALAMVRRSYRPPHTVGSAYVALLREVLDPLGVVVVDAAHPAVSVAAHPVLLRALSDHAAVEQAIRARDDELRLGGYEPQVDHVDGRTLVFSRAGGRRQRVAGDRAASLRPAPGDLTPNVLLRPVVERTLLPTVAYLAGPGELAYFAQVSVVAAALGAPQPLALPRWSVTIVEPHIEALLERHGFTLGDFADQNAVESRRAREAWPEDVAGAFAGLRDALAARVAALRSAVAGHRDLQLPAAVLEGAQRSLEWRLGRLERRLTAAVKRRESQLMHDLGTLRGALAPGGHRQERALNFMPLLARHGLELLEHMRESAAEHARELVRGVVAAPLGS